MKKDKGITLIELMISLILATFVIVLAFYISTKQFKYSITQESKSKLEIESFSGINIITHDIIHSGYGVKLSIKPVDCRNTSPDTLIIISNAINTSITPTWSVLMQKVQLSKTLLVRRWTEDNIKKGDWIVVLSDDKNLIGGPFEVNDVIEVDGPDLNGDGSPDPALNLKLSIQGGVTSGKASFIFKVSPDHIADTVKYYVANNTLFRNDAPLIDNVEDFELSFLLDTDYNGVYDTWTHDVKDLNAEELRAQLGVVRFSILVREEKQDLQYTYPYKKVRVEEHVLEINNPHYRRVLITKSVRPRNL